MNILIGKVVNNSMDKTIVVLVDRIFKHVKYNKYLKRNKRYYVHDEYNLALKDDIVQFFYFRSISKMKCWFILSIF